MRSDELKGLVRGEVFKDKESLEKASRDYSLFQIVPSVVVCPRDEEDVKALVTFATEKRKAGEKVSLTARAAGTDMTGGPLTKSIVVSLTPHMNRIRRIEPTSVTVEPGVYYRDLEKELSAHGLLYPPYTASKDLCALGGMIANNSGGEKTLAYGKTDQYVRSLRVALADGKIHELRPLSGSALDAKFKEEGFEGDLYRGVRDLIKKHKATITKAEPDVTKNSAGYAIWNVWDGKTFDLTQLIVGSQGTLGLVTEATLRVIKKKPHSRMVVVFVHDLKDVADMVVEALKHHPESVESYDDKTLTVALKFWRDVIRTMKGGAISLALQFIPEALMALRGGIPKMVVLVEFADEQPGRLLKRIETFRDAMNAFTRTHKSVQFRVLRNADEAQKYWAIRRQSFALLHGHIPDKDTAPFIDDFVVKPQYLPEFLPKLDKILNKYKKDLIYTVAGHPGNGNFHIIPLMDLKKSRVRALIPSISKQVYDLVLEYHGSITGEHNDGLIRTPYLEQMYGKEIVSVFEEIKHLFDPLNIFNPGKKVGGSLKENLKYISSART